MKHRYTWRTGTRELILMLGALLVCLPFYLLVVGSLKTLDENYAKPLNLPAQPIWANYSDAWNPGYSETSLGLGLLNSLVITGSTVALLIVLGSLAGYVLGRRVSRLSSFLYVVFVAGLILPFQLAIIPVYMVMAQLGLLGTKIAAIIIGVGLQLPIAVFLYTGFVRRLPKEFEEAALLDGAGSFRIWRSVLLPLLKPITITVAVLTGLSTWNDFFMPLVFIGTGNQNTPATVQIYQFVGEFVSSWNLIFAGVVVVLAPVLIFYFFAQRQIIEGTSAGIKG